MTLSAIETTTSARQFLRAAWQAFVPEHVRTRIYRMRLAANLSRPVIENPTYADDGLISQHVTAFMEDQKFLRAYAVARAGLDWSHPGEIHFRAYIACWAAKYALSLPGDLVECGVAHGVLSKTICEYLDFSTARKRLFLFDTFRGIPTRDLTDATEIGLAQNFNETHYADDLLPLVRDRFGSYPNVVIVPGIVPDTLRATSITRISYLSIDMNNAPAEIGAIIYLWDKLVPGAVVLLDDYAYGPEFANQKTAWDEFAATKGVPILTLPTGQGMIIVPPAHKPTIEAGS